MKKAVLCVTLIMILCCILLVGCDDIVDDTVQVVCTIFPQYDFCKQIAKDLINVDVLLKSDVDVHNYELTLKDKNKIKNCDLFFYIGGTSEGWVDEVKNSTDLDNVKMVKLLDSVDCEDSHDHEDSTCDEHIWTSLKNAIKICATIKDSLCSMYPQYVDEFNSNYQVYISELASLDSQFEHLINNADKDTIVVADRFPFKYFTEDYGLNYLSAFEGCSSATDVPILTKIALKNALNDFNLKGVIVLESGDRTLANSLIEGTNKKIFTMHSCQTIKASDYENGVTYLDLMRNNYRVLEEVLYD